jgi:hypothetical protein
MMLQQISYYAKIISPFLASVLSLLTAYADRHTAWKLIGSLLAALFFTAVGCLGILRI